jgi:hypothetical protein
VIVVVGAIAAAGAGTDTTPTGLAAGIALAAAAAGARVEVVTRLGEDAAGDALLLALAAAGVGHVATLRDAVHATAVAPPVDEPIDLDAIDEQEADDGVGRLTTAQSAGADSSPPPTLDAADVGLAMRYLSDYRVIVVVHPADEGIVREVVAATSWASAHLVCITLPDASVPMDLPRDAVVLAATDDAAGLAGLLGRYVAAVDGGDAPEAAFQATLAAPA